MFMTQLNNTPRMSHDRLTQAQQCLKNQDVLKAEFLLDRLIQEYPTWPQANYYKAVCARLKKQHSMALKHLRVALKHQTDYGRAWQEIGHNYRDQENTPQAIDAYRKAVELNPGLMASWRELAKLLDQSNQPQEAAMAKANHARLAQLDPTLQAVTSLMHDKRLLKAEQLCRRFLKAHPTHTEAMRLLAAIGAELNILDDAEFLLESALEFDPTFDLARLDYIQVLHKRQKYQQALEQAKELRRRLPDNLAAQMAYATQTAAMGQYEEALAVLDQLLAVAPNPANIHMQRGHALKTIGKKQSAIEAYRRAAHHRPTFGDAWWSLANMKTYRFSDEDLERMLGELRLETLSPVDRYHLSFALGKAFEDREDFECSFKHYAEGNALKKAELRYSADKMQAEFDRQKAFFTLEQVNRFEGLGHPAPDPIFIVGLPRAGSTLIEQILASHSQVDGTLELPNILAMAHRLNGRQLANETPNYPKGMRDLSDDEISALGAQYLRETRIHRAQGPYFTDKMPNNFRHIGLIKTILPNAKIIDARRHPMACCFSGFKQLFAQGQEFSYGQKDIGRYYRGYVDLMDHWHQCYPGEILQVDYEAVVSDLDNEVRRILDFLGLPFEPACMEFHQTQRSVRTASAEQVRQPVYQSGVAQWRHFEPWLGPLRLTLAPFL